MDTLISNVDIKKSRFKNDPDLKYFLQKKYTYQGQLIENLKMEDLLNEQYRNRLIADLIDHESEDDPKAESIALLSQFLIMRMELLQDSDTFFILSELSKNVNMSYMGIELFSDSFVHLFYQSPLFYIKKSHKYNTTLIMETIVRNMGALTEDYLLERKGSCPAKSGMILIYKSRIDGLEDSDAKKKILLQKPIKAEFELVNLGRNEKSVSYFYDIHPFLKEQIQNNLTPDELKFYLEKIYPFFEDIEIHNYQVQDKDGYVNIRKEPSASSDIVGTAKTGDYVCYISSDKHNPNWIYIHYKEIAGYIHKSRLIRK